MAEIRLQKIIADAGIASRRKAEELITQCLVKVNGKIVDALGTKADPDVDVIEVSGRKIVRATKASDMVYYMLNKPRGYLSAASDKGDRPVVVDLLKRVKKRVYPVGRLDYDTDGIMILTNDGDLTNKLLHPKFDIEKTYHVKVKNVPRETDLDKLRKGVIVVEGKRTYKTKPAKVKFIKKAKENTWIEITITEGRKHIIKNMCFRIGFPVQRLRRVVFAGLKLGSLKLGDFRPLTERELKKIKKLAGATAGKDKKKK